MYQDMYQWYMYRSFQANFTLTLRCDVNSGRKWEFSTTHELQMWRIFTYHGTKWAPVRSVSTSRRIDQSLTAYRRQLGWPFVWAWMVSAAYLMNSSLVCVQYMYRRGTITECLLGRTMYGTAYWHYVQCILVQNVCMSSGTKAGQVFAHQAPTKLPPRSGLIM